MVAVCPPGTDLALIKIKWQKTRSPDLLSVSDSDPAVCGRRIP
jgi:hypothetical protein